MKVIKSHPSSSCMISLQEEYSNISAGPNSFTTTRSNGNFINGPLSISSSIENIKVNGIYRFNPQLSTGIPSTMITPVPTLVFDLPVKNISTSVSSANVLLGLL